MEKKKIEAQPTEQKKEPVKRAREKLVWCGGTIKGVVEQYTVFVGGIPNELKQFIEAVPLAKSFLVDLDDFPKMFQKINSKESAEYEMLMQLQKISGGK